MSIKTFLPNITHMDCSGKLPFMDLIKSEMLYGFILTTLNFYYGISRPRKRVRSGE